jgi:hypothetical protein
MLEEGISGLLCTRCTQLSGAPAPAARRAGLELSKQTEGELAKRNHVYQKTIKTLLAKLKQQDVTLRDEEEELSRQVRLSVHTPDSFTQQRALHSASGKSSGAKLTTERRCIAG